MNLKSYDKSTRILKQADLAGHGQILPSNTNALVLGVIDCTQNGGQQLQQNIAFSIRKNEGIPLQFSIPNFNYLQRLTPATTKYTGNYIDNVAKNTEALIRTNMLDGVVAVIDNYVTGLGVLTGCTRANCPLLFMTTGMMANQDTTLLLAAGKMATREIKGTESDQVVNHYCHQSGIATTDTLTVNFCKLAEAFDLMLPGTTQLTTNTGAMYELALHTGVTALQRADDIITPKRLISKRTLNECLEKYQAQGGDVSGLLLFENILNMVDLKIPALYPSLKTTLADQAYMVADSTAPLLISGQAWVYNTLADAMTALCSNAIDTGVIVLQNCTGSEVSILAHTVNAMQKQNEIAIFTDGYCAATPVLTIANVVPDAYANQDFANIQNGDILEIDVTKGRININTNAKDMKLRAKRNVVKKHEIYF